MRPEYDETQVSRRLRSLGESTNADPEHPVGEKPDAYHAAEPADSRPTITRPGPFDPLPRPVLRLDLSLAYVIALVIAAVFATLVAWLGILPWYFTVAMILLLATTLIEGWKRLTVLGTLAVIVILVISLISAWKTIEPVSVPIEATPPSTARNPIPGSLGLYIDQLTDAWNGVTTEPQIIAGLTRNSEVGDYDTFIYRFGGWGRIAGAYDPGTEAIYALLATGQLSETATSQLYVHLCFVVAPYSQECLDSYKEVGLGGGLLEDFTDIEHAAEWSVGDHTWRLQIDQNVLVIRVYGADAA